jgi:hypothetical protein
MKGEVIIPGIPFNESGQMPRVVKSSSKSTSTIFTRLIIITRNPGIIMLRSIFFR